MHFVFLFLATIASSCSFDKSLLLQVLPKDKLMVTPRGIQFKVPGILPPQEVITISIGMNDILKVKEKFLRVTCMYVEKTNNPFLFRYWHISASPCRYYSSTFHKMHVPGCEDN